jgi:hypothetical protein|tara:strand:- start:2796 stop:2960 length:165 start_codon:yes stop_codon:yes gene_type:complete
MLEEMTHPLTTSLSLLGSKKSGSFEPDRLPTKQAEFNCCFLGIFFLGAATKCSF